MKSSKIISIGNRGISKEIQREETKQGFQWKVGLTYIKSNSDGGFPVGFNSMEVGRN